MESATVCTSLGILLWLAAYCFTIKAESDYWKNQPQSYRSNVWILILVGVIPFAWFCYSKSCGSDTNVPVLVILDYLSLCLLLTGFWQLKERSWVSKNFSEFWLFGFFKGDNFLANMFYGTIGLVVCTFSLIVMATGAIADSHHVVATKPVSQTSVLGQRKSAHTRKKVAPNKPHRMQHNLSSQA